MGYRNITVDGVDYKYVIGKSYTKVRGINKVFDNHKIGRVIDDFKCQVRPSDVADAIRNLE